MFYYAAAYCKFYYFGISSILGTGYDFDFKSLERKLILPVQRTYEGDEVSYFYSFRYDNEKEGLLVSLSQRIQRKDSFYEEEVSLLGNKNQKEFFKRVSPLSQES